MALFATNEWADGGDGVKLAGLPFATASGGFGMAGTAGGTGTAEPGPLSVASEDEDPRAEVLPKDMELWVREAVGR